MTATPPKEETRNFLIYVGVGLASAMLFLYLVFGTPSFLAIQSSASQPTLIVTETVTSSQFNTIGTTTTEIATASEITTEVITVTQQLPPYVTLSGQVRTTGLNTIPTDLTFTASDGSIYRATIEGNHYSVQLPNPESYTVKVHYTVSPIGSGDCNIGTFWLKTTDTSGTANIEC